MLNRTYPDSVLNSFDGDSAQESGLRRVQLTSKDFTIAALQNQEIPAISCAQCAESFHNTLRNPGCFVGTGNRCGHNLLAPRGVNLPKEAKRPVIIRQLIDASQKLYQRPRGSKRGHGALILIRSEGRESRTQFLTKLFYDLELSTMTVCLNDITYPRPTLKDMTSDSAETGLSYSRAKREEARLIKEGYLHVTRSPKYRNGEFRADPSRREVTFKLFRELGLAREYIIQKHYKIKRLEKRGLKNSFQKDLVDKLKESFSASSHKASANENNTHKKGIKTGSFPENRNKEDQAHRQKLIGLYVEVCQKKGIGVSGALLRSMAEKMTTDNLISLLKLHTADTS